MPSTKKIFKKILIWRYKNISERQFIYVLSIISGEWNYGNNDSLFFIDFEVCNIKDKKVKVSEMNDKLDNNEVAKK